MKYVYILQSKVSPERYYVGSTLDLKRRFAEHNSGQSPHTNKHAPWSLLCYTAFSDHNKGDRFKAFRIRQSLCKKALLRTIMVARIYKPARTAMQAGEANTKGWVIDYEPETPREVEPLMGWTASADMKSQLRLCFATKEEAVAYCERRGIPYQLSEAKEPARKKIAYADNFGYKRRDQWTH